MSEAEAGTSRRGYRTALRQFLAWHLSLSQGGGQLSLSRALVQRYRVTLEGRRPAPSTINQHLTAIRALADECAESGLLDQPTAARRWSGISGGCRQILSPPSA